MNTKSSKLQAPQNPIICCLNFRYLCVQNGGLILFYYSIHLNIALASIYIIKSNINPRKSTQNSFKFQAVKSIS